MAGPGTGILSFGMVAIPIKLFSATQDRGIHFHYLHAKCGARIQNRIFCLACNQVVERADLVRGYEVAKGEYIQFTEAELENLEVEANKNIELKEFIPASSVDPVYFDGSYYLGPDKGGEKAYRLLTIAMIKSNRAAVAEMVSHGKEELVVIRAYQNGLVLQAVYYAKEVRDFSLIDRAENVRLSDEERELGVTLIEQLSQKEFKPEKYSDDYRARVLAMVEEKAKGQEVVSQPDPAAAKRSAQVIDLVALLKNSMEKAKPQKKPATKEKKARAG